MGIHEIHHWCGGTEIFEFIGTLPLAFPPLVRPGWAAIILSACCGTTACGRSDWAYSLLTFPTCFATLREPSSYSRNDEAANGDGAKWRRIFQSHPANPLKAAVGALLLPIPAILTFDALRCYGARARIWTGDVVRIFSCRAMGRGGRRA